jgi:hypothetical protein
MNEDMCKHLLEAVQICKWVHRRKLPELIFIFDGSSNHGAKALDALHVGGGINRDPGGTNAPGSKGTQKNQQGYPKMRNGWFIDKATITCLIRAGNAQEVPRERQSAV